MIDAVQTVMQDKSVLNAAVYCAAGLTGQLLHGVKKWAEKESSMKGWFIANPRRTIAAVIGNLTIMAGFISLGDLSTMALGTALATGLFQGLAADSVLNRGSRTKWSAEDRKGDK